MFFNHIGNHRFNLSRSFICKIVEQQVSCFFTRNRGVTYRIKLNILAQKFLNQRFLFTRAGYFDSNFRTVFPFQQFAYVRTCFAFGANPVHFQNFIAGAQVIQLSRFSFIGFRNDNFSIALHDQGTDAGIFTGSHHFKVIIHFFGHVDGVRIEFHQHIINAGFHQFAVLE